MASHLSRCCAAAGAVARISIFSTLALGATDRATAGTRAQGPQDPPPQGEQGPAKPPSSRLPEVVIRESADDGRRLEQVPIDNIGGRDLIGPQEVRQAGSTNLQELLRRSPGVHISEETGSDSLPNIAVRGVTNGAEGAWRSINLGMYADGIPLAPAPYGQPGNSLFPFPLERVYAIDVQRGGGAVRYGPNNVSGVVNFLTRPIPVEPTVVGRVRVDTFANTSYYAAYGATEGPLGLLIEAVYKDGESFRDNGDYTIQNYAIKASYALAKDVRLFGQIETFDDDSRLSDGLTTAAYQADPSQTLSPQNRFRGEQDRANLKLEWDIDADTLFEVVTYWFDGTRTFFLGSPTFYGDAVPTFIQATPRPIRTVAVQPQITHSYRIGGGEGELLFGLRYLQEDIVRNVTRFFPDGTSTLRSEEQYDYYTASAFVENRFRFGAWTVTPGLRFEYVAIDARNRISGETAYEDFVEVLPALGIAHQFTTEWAAYAGVQSTFAAPQAPQIEISSDPQDISAQYAWNYEVGTRWRHREGVFGADLTLYQIDYSDRLVPDPDQFDVFVNAGSSRHRGVELALDSDLTAVGLTGVSLWSNTSWNDSRFTNGQFDGNRFAGAPEWLASWGARYRHAPSGLWLSVDGTYVGAAFSDAENTRELNAQGTRGERPSYVVWNAAVGWDHDLGDKTEVSALVGGRNILDEEYFEPRTARGIYPGPPASMVFQLGVTHRL
ncbi:MAG: TonB-dependent receptor [Planctomycetes bacterium]|nr:TonB-dependent receptor [Planctomycetota bacterium]